ncbi:hypothetical protein CUN85_09995 [Methanolobus halotolerans]|uniref:Uncharacterized protein n=1 Tax=Methanolobus halotolerans TaxID=2052935 RepID=A0A4E0PVL1_9EURY|nr:hypothetical protein CUN85_09995 [Methanolobus halotolerans]
MSHQEKKQHNHPPKAAHSFAEILETIALYRCLIWYYQTRDTAQLRPALARLSADQHTVGQGQGIIDACSSIRAGVNWGDTLEFLVESMSEGVWLSRVTTEMKGSCVHLFQSYDILFFGRI